MEKVIRRIGRIVAAKLLPKIPYPVLKGPIRGTKFVLGSLAGRGGGVSVYFNLVEEKQTIEFTNQLRSNDTVFDVGANVGYYSVIASKIIGTKGTVIAFEPVVRNLHYLYKHVELNNLRNVMILPFACSDTSSFETFSFGFSSAEGHLIQSNSNIMQKFDPESVAFVCTITIDDFVDNTGVGPSVIKIDVEGAELSVLKGAERTLSTVKPKIFLSVHTSELEIECQRYLSKIGYQYKLLDEKERPSVEYLFF